MKLSKKNLKSEIELKISKSQSLSGRELLEDLIKHLAEVFDIGDYEDLEYALDDWSDSYMSLYSGWHQGHSHEELSIQVIDSGELLVRYSQQVFRRDLDKSFCFRVK